MKINNRLREYLILYQEFVLIFSLNLQKTVQRQKILWFYSNVTLNMCAKQSLVAWFKSRKISLTWCFVKRQQLMKIDWPVRSWTAYEQPCWEASAAPPAQTLPAASHSLSDAGSFQIPGPVTRQPSLQFAERCSGFEKNTIHIYFLFFLRPIIMWGNTNIIGLNVQNLLKCHKSQSYSCGVSSELWK